MQKRNKPIFSIVTVCFNEEKKIGIAMESVLNQAFTDYEYIVVDGGSRDSTVEIIKSYEEKFAGRLKWISEKDKGLYDAMNKAIKMANGEYISFINADDTLQPDVLGKIAKLAQYEDADIIYGNALNVYTVDERTTTRINRANPHISIDTLQNGMGVVHQSIFTRTEFINGINGFNIKYRIGADWDFLIRSVKNNAKLKYVDMPICSFQTDGVSSKVHNKERHIIRKDNGLYKVIDWAMIRDILNLKNMIQLVIGQENFKKLRYIYNKRRKY